MGHSIFFGVCWVSGGVVSSKSLMSCSMSSRSNPVPFNSSFVLGSSVSSCASCASSYVAWSFALLSTSMMRSACSSSQSM